MNPFAEQVLRMIDGGFLRATSVGFRPIKYSVNATRGGLDFAECDLLEFSICPVGSNPEALIVGRALGCTEDSKGARSRLIANAGSGDVVLEFDVDDDDAIIDFDADAVAAIRMASTRARAKTGAPLGDPAARFRSDTLDITEDEIVVVIRESTRAALHGVVKNAVFQSIGRRLGRVD